jgi:hypothetical protein
LAAVNFCLFIVGTVQVSRILSYNASQKGSLKEGAKGLGEDVKDQAKDLKANAEKELKA